MLPPRTLFLIIVPRTRRLDFACPRAAGLQTQKLRRAGCPRPRKYFLASTSELVWLS
jgi:hypothetical protein